MKNQRGCLQLYLGDVNRYKLLTETGANDLVYAMRGDYDKTSDPVAYRSMGPKKAKETLVGSNLRLVISIAKKYAGNGVQIEDAIQEGSIGLAKAADTYDPARGKFSTYAAKVITTAIRDNLNPGIVHIQRNRVRACYRWIRKRRELAAELGREPEDGEVATSLEIRHQTIAGIKQAALVIGNPIKSLSDGEEYGNPLYEALKNEKAIMPEDAASKREELKMLKKAIRRMPRRQARVLKMRYGLDGCSEMTLKEVGAVLRISRERVRQIEVDGLNEVKEYLSGKI